MKKTQIFKMKKLFLTLAFVMFLSFLFSTSVFAGQPAPPSGATNPKILTGALDLIKYATNWLYALIPVTCITVFSYNSWQRSHADDPSEANSRTKKIRQVLLWGPIALGGNAIINIFMHFLT